MGSFGDRVPRILLVDDEPEVLSVTERLLETAGCSVTPYLAPQDALDAFADNPEAFDLVLTDSAMPGLTGVSLATKIVALRPGFPVILVTGRLRAAGSPEADCPAVFCTLLKPVRSADLAAAIRTALEAQDNRPGPG